MTIGQHVQKTPSRRGLSRRQDNVQRQRAALALGLLGLLGTALAAPPGVGVPWAQAREQLTPRAGRPGTVLVQAGQAAAVIGVPDDPAYAAAGKALQDAVEQRTGLRLPLVAASTLVTGPAAAFSAAVLRPTAAGGRSLLLLGDLSSNRAVQRLYIDYVAFEDASYPGQGGYTVRTVVDPQGLGWNAVVFGGPGPADVAAAVNAGLSALRLEDGVLSLDYTLRVSFGTSSFLAEIRRRTDAAFGQVPSWARYTLKPDSPEYAQQNPDKAPLDYALNLLNVPLVYGGLHYALSGRPEFAQAVGRAMDALYENLDWVEARRNSGYDEHYSIEIWLRAWQQVAAGPLLSPAQRERGAAVLGFLAGQMAMYRQDLAAYGKTSYRILSRHEYAGVFAGDALCRYVQRHGQLSGDLATVVADNRRNFGTVIDTMLQGYTTGFDHKWGLDGNWHLLQQAMEEPRPQYVESGMARLNADYAALCISNAGSFVNFGADNVAPTEPYDSWQTIGRAALLFRDDGGYQWLLDNRMRQPPYKVFILGLNYLAHGYQTAGPAREPEYLKGLNRILVNAPLYEDLVAGRGRLYTGTPVVNQVPLAETFSKITFRDGLGSDDQYLLLDGLGGVTYSGNDANSICEYSRYGQRLLVQIETSPDPFYQNLVSVCRGNAGAPNGTFARVLDYADFPSVALVRSAVDPLCGTRHVRSLFMEKGGYFLCLDDLTLPEAQEAYLTCTFRALGEPDLDAAHGTWVVRGEKADLRLQNVSLPDLLPEPGFSTAERFSGATPDQWAFRIKLLRESAARSFQAGETYRFANLFYGVRTGEAATWQAQALSRDVVAVCGPRRAVYGVPLGDEGRVGALGVAASAFRLAADSAQFVALRRLTIAGTVRAQFATPVTLEVDVASGACRLQSPALQPAGTVRWVPAWQVSTDLAGLEQGVPLPAGGTATAALAGLREEIAALLASLPAAAAPALRAPAVTAAAPQLDSRALLPAGPAVHDALWAHPDGEPPLLLCARTDGHLLATRLDGQTRFDVDSRKAPLLALWYGPLNGAPAVLWGAQDGTLGACDLAGTPLWQVQNTHLWYGQQPAVYSIAVADFGGTGSPRIAVGTHGGVSLFDSHGSFLKFTQLYAHAVFPAEPATLLDPAHPWLLVNTWGGGLKLVDPAAGQVLDGWSSFWGGSASCLQLQRFGGSELYAVHAGTIGIGCGRLDPAALNAAPAGTASPWAKSSWYRRTDGETRGVAVVDLNRDGTPEILTGNEAGFVVCYDLEGNVLWRRLVGFAISALLAADLDGDHVPELILAGDTPAVRIVDASWRELGAWTPASGSPAQRVWVLDQALAVQTADGAVSLLSLAGLRHGG